MSLRGTLHLKANRLQYMWHTRQFVRSRGGISPFYISVRPSLQKNDRVGTDVLALAAVVLQLNTYICIHVLELSLQVIGTDWG